MARKQKTSRNDAALAGGEDPRPSVSETGADGRSPLQAAGRPEEPAETGQPVEAAEAETEAGAQTEAPSGPAVPSASARRAQALIDASKATGFPPPPAALKALNEETA